MVPSRPSLMTEDGTGELVNRFYELGGTGEIDAVLALLAPDFQLVYSGPSIIPAAGTWRGHDGFRRWFEAGVQGHLPPESLNVEEQFVHGDKVVIRDHVNVRVKTAGKTCETDFLHLWTVRDRKIASFTDFFDTYALAQAYLT